MKKTYFLPMAMTLYLVWLVPQLVFFKEGALWGAYSNVWADWAIHLTYLNHFAKLPTSHWFLQNPIFAGEPLRYPNFVNLLSAALYCAGSSLTFSLWIVSLIALIALVWLSRAFLTNSGMLILFLGSGMSISGGKLAYGNHFRDILFPQRGYAWGLIVGLSFLLCLTRRPANRKWKWVSYATAVIAGLLPVIHVHSVVGVGTAFAFFCLFERARLKENWKIAATFIMVTGVTWIGTHFTLPSNSFVGLQIGWIATPEKTGFIWPMFWLVSWGAFLPLALMSLTIREGAPPRWLTYSGFALFFLANFVRFQPWEWDNTKIFFWSYLFLIPSVIHCLYFQGQKGRWMAVVEKFLFLSLIIPGSWEAITLLNLPKNQVEMFSANELENARQVEKLVPPTAVVLGNSDAHDFVSALAGRTVYLGYDGWLWAHGIDYHPRQLAVRKFYSAPKADPQFLKKNRIEFLVTDPRQRTQFPTTEGFFDTLKEIYRNGEMAVYSPKTN